MPDDLLATFFINPQYLFAGLMGGLVHAFRVKKVPRATPWDIIGYMVVGALAANFIGPQLFRIISQVPPGFVGFGIGMSGKKICFLVEKFFNRADIIGKTK